MNPKTQAYIDELECIKESIVGGVTSSVEDNPHDKFDMILQYVDTIKQQLPGCEKAAAFIETTLDLFRSSDHYQDLVAGSDSQSWFGSLIESSANVDMDTETLKQFKHLIYYYRQHAVYMGQTSMVSGLDRFMELIDLLEQLESDE
jgi:hypothetical protein